MTSAETAGGNAGRVRGRTRRRGALGAATGVTAHEVLRGLPLLEVLFAAPPGVDQVLVGALHRAQQLEPLEAVAGLERQMIVRVNAMPLTIAALNRVPIKQVGQTTVYLSDVAHVRDGWAVQQNIVRAEGKRSVLLTIIKNGDASTLDVVNRVKAALPEIQKAAPPGLHIDLMFDQSVFVQNAISAVLREGAIAAGLTALMILIFLGSWRSTLVATMTSYALATSFLYHPLVSHICHQQLWYPTLHARN